MPTPKRPNDGPLHQWWMLPPSNPTDAERAYARQLQSELEGLYSLPNASHGAIAPMLSGVKRWIGAAKNS